MIILCQYYIRYFMYQWVIWSSYRKNEKGKIDYFMIYVVYLCNSNTHWLDNKIGKYIRVDLYI